MSTPVVVEKVINAPVSRVWKAITSHEEMQKWYFKMPAFEPKKGFEFTFLGSSKGQTFTHLCTITEVIENKKLQHTWSFKEYEGMSVVTWELTDMGGKTKVTLTHTGLETFGNEPALAPKNFEAGWTAIVGTNLPKFLE
ncbi:MAG: SRPBCC domain-containing protein [Bacteroidota bacterium]